MFQNLVQYSGSKFQYPWNVSASIQSGVHSTEGDTARLPQVNLLQRNLCPKEVQTEIAPLACYDVNSSSNKYAHSKYIYTASCHHHTLRARSQATRLRPSKEEREGRSGNQEPRRESHATGRLQHAAAAPKTSSQRSHNPGSSVKHQVLNGNLLRPVVGEAPK